MKRYIKNEDIKYLNQILISVPVSDEWVEYKPATAEEDVLNDGWLPYENIDDEKQEKIQQVIEYDKSIDVNSFFINGVQSWIDRDTRASVAYSTNIRLRNGFENTTLWLNGVPFEIQCQLLIQLLDSLEIYALDCYNVTEQHKQSIMNLQTYNDVVNYDFTVGYPEKLNITL